MHGESQCAPACTASTGARGKFGSEFETEISYNAPMHFRDRQTDTDIVAQARANNENVSTNHSCSTFSQLADSQPL